jgi:SAM-dependent methyltransferase
VSDAYASNIPLLNSRKPTVLSAVRTWWREQPDDVHTGVRLRRLAEIAREFARDSLPDRKRQRFGDAGYDWDYRVDTTSANVGWRARLIGSLNSSYQPIEADIFREIINTLAIDFNQHTFIDIGSGKGRALLLASEFPFRRIIGIELLPELNRIAEENIGKFSNAQGRTMAFESVCGDATEFKFPDEPLVVYLFHPLTEAGFRKVLVNLQSSLKQFPRPAQIVYVNPIFEMILAGMHDFKKVTGTHQYAVYEAVERRV